MHYDYDAIIAVAVDSPAPNPSDPCQDWKKADIDLSAEDTAYIPVDWTTGPGVREYVGPGRVVYWMRGETFVVPTAYDPVTVREAQLQAHR